MNIAGFIVLLFFFCTQVSAQDKTLNEVRIRYKRVREKELQDERLNLFAPGMKLLKIDSSLMEQYALQNISQLLSRQAPVFIKSYGINSLATLNFRGSSAAQAQVLWNGVPLNNASVGMADISLLSVNNFDRINIAYGGSAALLGSGNVGAALLLDNDFGTGDSARQWKTGLAAEAGSFGQYKLAVQEQYAGRKFFIGLKLMGQTANNNFTYAGQQGERQEMSNAGFRSYSSMLNFAYRFNAKSHLKLSAWYQAADRAIPPALFERFSVKKQQDASLRLLLEWDRKLSNDGKLYTRTAFINDAQRYTDTTIGLANENRTFQFYEELGWKKSIHPQHEVLLFVPVNISWTQVLQDSQRRFQYKVAIAAAYRYQAFGERLQFAANLRLEQINEQTIFLPGINASYALFRFFKFRANVQRSYRAPTLNEWYYQPGGNPDLKPEQGWSQDAGYELNLRCSPEMVFSHDVSIFNRVMNDWILWFGGSIWTPHNIARVHSRGVETINSVRWSNRDWNFNLGLNTSFVLATTQQSYVPGDGSIGKQIPYSPRYNGQATAGWGYKAWSATYNHTYTGYRFTTVDESAFLIPYQTGNLYVAYGFGFDKLKGRLSVQCNNLWNNAYQVVNARPMPGRNVALGMKLEF